MMLINLNTSTDIPLNQIHVMFVLIHLFDNRGNFTDNIYFTFQVIQSSSCNLHDE